MRASALSYKIYDTAKGAQYQWLKLSKRTASALREDSNSDVIANQYPVFGRAWRGLTDSSLVAMVIVFENPGELPPYSIYVVFRGSSGDKNHGGVGFMGGTPVGGGQSTTSQAINIDWRANFDNVQDPADWGGGGFMIHGGYKSVLGSYRDRKPSDPERQARLDPRRHSKGIQIGYRQLRYSRRGLRSAAEHSGVRTTCSSTR